MKLPTSFSSLGLNFINLSITITKKKKEKKMLHMYICAKILRSGVADYVIFLITLYDITFQWWSNTHNSNQNLLLSMINFILFCWIHHPRAAFFYCWNFNIKENSKLKKWCNFGGFQLPEWRERNTKKLAKF